MATQENLYDPWGLAIEKKVVTDKNKLPNFESKDRFTYNGKETQSSLGYLDYGARMYDPSIGRWGTIDPLIEHYENLTPYCYVSNNPINAIDPDGKKIIYVNGHWDVILGGLGLSPKLPWKEKYWDFFDKRFIPSVRNFFNTSPSEKDLFIDGSSIIGFDQDGNDRYKLGEKYAEKHFDELMYDMAKGETLKIVSHSEGGAFAAGMAAAIQRRFDTMGHIDGDRYHRVEALLYLSPDEAKDFRSPKGIKAYQIHAKNDIVSSADRLKGVDYFLLLLGEKTMEAHGATPTSNAVNRLKESINDFLRFPDVTSIKSKDGQSIIFKRND